MLTEDILISIITYLQKHNKQLVDYYYIYIYSAEKKLQFIMRKQFCRDPNNLLDNILF
jgi:hypothetical protein